MPIKRHKVHEGRSARGTRGLFRGEWMVLPLREHSIAKEVAERLGYEFIDPPSLPNPVLSPLPAQEKPDENPEELTIVV